MLQSAEFEAAIMARRVDIQALCAEARRLEESEAEDDSELDIGITVPSGWLAALAQGLAFVTSDRKSASTEESAAGRVEDIDAEELEVLERIRSLASAIRDVEPGDAYAVSSCDYEALSRGIAGALFIQEIELKKLSEHVDPPVLRFVTIEQLGALWRFYGALNDLLERAEEP